MENERICTRCGKPAVGGITYENGICYVCHKELLPTCQYPGCEEKCDHNGDILCEKHFYFFTHNAFSQKLTKEFLQKFSEKGIYVRIYETE